MKKTMNEIFNLIKEISENTLELNMSNYSHEQAGLLNNALIEIYQLVHEEYASHKDDDSNLCCICHKNYVDSADGYDTCQWCLKINL